jgi:hypothetical protein
MNIPGILKIEKIAFDSVSLPVLKNNDSVILDNYIISSPDEIDFITDTAGADINYKKNDAGYYFDVSITFLKEGYDETSLSEVNYLTEKPHLYIITEKSGMKYLIGFDYRPFPKFSYSFKNDPDGKGGRSMSCKIEFQTTIFPVYVISESGGGGEIE